MTPQKYLITGGAGFIGSHTVDLLIANEHEVRVIDNLKSGNLRNLEQHKNCKKFQFHKMDLTEIEDDARVFKDIDVVIHFAGIGDIVPSIDKPVDYLSNNVMGTSKILEACRKNRIKRFIYAASSSCYGIAEVPTNENHKIDPKYPYAMSKYLGEVLAFHWARVYGLEVNSLRIFNAYGTRSKTNGTYGAVFGVFLKQIIENQPLTVVGNGNQLRDFVYVTDVARAFYLAGEHKTHGEIFNIGAGNPRSVSDIVKIMDKDYVSIPERPGEPIITFADISKAQRILDWNPTIKLEEGIKFMIDDLDFWKNAPLWTPQTIEKATSNWFKYLNTNKVLND